MKGTRRIAALFALLSIGVLACQDTVGTGAPLFERVPPEESGVTFANIIEEDLQVNILSFEYLYNGGGVALGDVTGDGLPDIFLTATQGANRLYRNLGDFSFEDITIAAGVAGRDSSMSTGASMADVNGDGWLDLYVCQTGKPEWPFDTRNLLYINNGDGTFAERAAEFGLDSRSLSNQAAFVDVDLDGDLDVYIINHPPDFREGNVVSFQPSAPQPLSSDQLLRNDGGVFTDVSELAGIRNHAFGLSATVTDSNDDGWPDIYVANDYVQPDFLYVNRGDGTFQERGREAMAHTSHFGMGSDAADINNDGLEDIVVLDMMAEDARRQRLLASVMKRDRYKLQQQYGYGNQIMRNTLQLNNGEGSYSEIGELAGVSTTDWSWGPLLADFDNDGLRDLFVTNGYRRDVTNLDYMMFTVDSLNRAGGGRAQVQDIYSDYLQFVPSEPLANYAFRNVDSLGFENVAEQWGLAEPGFSNGAAYADLDGDGDLDLVVNDIDATARLYRNGATERFPERNWLRIRFEGPPGNAFGLGTRVTFESDSAAWVATNRSTRGFYSSVEPVVHIGIGETRSGSLRVTWPDGRSRTYRDVAAGAVVTVRYDEAEALTEDRPDRPEALFELRTPTPMPFNHQEDGFVDFKREPLLPHMHSREGPPLLAADINHDGLTDLVIGGAAGQPGRVFIQAANGLFAAQDGPWSGPDAEKEDTVIHAFDSNGDGALDLYVGSGGSHVTTQDELARQTYQDRLYLGDGAGGFRNAPPESLPAMPMPTGAVASGDFDGDGDDDLFVGGRLVPGRWPESPRSYLLRNDDGRFVDVTAELAPALAEVGLVTGAAFADLDGNVAIELVLVGEWMAPQVWSASPDGRWQQQQSGLDGFQGWWNTVVLEDLDGDGDPDLLAGNLGLNSRIRGSADAPVRVYARDFDANGSLDPIMTLHYPDGREYPIHRREVIVQQLPYLKQRFPRFERYAGSTLRDVFSEAELKGARVREAGWLSTTWFENDGQGRFSPRALPVEAQLAPTYSAVVRDVDRDGHVDLILAGNSRATDVETGPYDAGLGLVLLGDGEGGFRPLTPIESGLSLRGDVRSMVWIETTDGVFLVVGNNDAALQVLALSRRPEG